MKVLLATDGSEFSEGAARFLTRFDFSAQDEIVVLHVVSEIPFEDDYRAQVRQFIRRAAPGILRTAAGILKPVKARVVTMEEEGYPDSTIMDIAANAGMDLIVMGARGIKGLKAFLLGSSTRSVVINSSKPVLVTKPAARGGGALKVLFAADGSDSAEVTGDLLTSLPLGDDTQVKIINVEWSAVSDIPERLALEVDEKMKETVARMRTVEAEAAERVVQEAELRLRRRFSNVGRIIEKGDPSTLILEESEKWEADMIAVGSRGLRGIRGMLGSVSRRTLGHAGCSVLVGSKTTVK
ncbi:MAG: universal stress protein [Candidatus Sulfobium sp.]|jgi:nucleotide-binding universal stress UspA family protein